MKDSKGGNINTRLKLSCEIGPFSCVSEGITKQPKAPLATRAICARYCQENVNVWLAVLNYAHSHPVSCDVKYYA